MKKVFTIFLALALCVPALAMQNLSGVALIGDDMLYYAGSVDGATTGLFAMGRGGEDAQMILSGNPLLLAGNDRSVLVNLYDEEEEARTVLLSRAGEELFTLPSPVFSAIEQDGVYYAGPYVVSAQDGVYSAKAYVSEGAEESWAYEPERASGNTLYYTDTIRYGMVTLEGDNHVGRLMKVNLATGEAHEVSPEGTCFLGLIEGRALYMRKDFYVFAEDDDVLQVEARPGVYLEGADGAGERRLAEIQDTDERFMSFSLLSGDTLYGSETNFAADIPECALLSLDLANGDIARGEMPYADIVGAQDGEVYLCATGWAQDEADESAQNDHLIALNASTGATRTVNQGQMLYYSESTPVFVFSAGRAFYLDYDMARSSTRLCAIDLDGANFQVIAQGQEWVTSGEEDI